MNLLGVLAVLLIGAGVVTLGLLVADWLNERRALAAFFDERPPPRSLRQVVAPLARLRIDGTAPLALVSGVGAGVALGVVGRSAAVGMVVGSVVALVVVVVRSGQRRRHQALLNGQLADALSSLASSMTAGSSFLRGLQELVGDAVPPLQPHLEQVMDEIEVGATPADAFRAMGERADLPVAGWLGHTLRLQERSGTPLVAMLQRLAGVVRQRDEVEREIGVLTAEGRIAAYVLTGLPLVLVVLIQLLDPGYLSVFAHGWGLVLTAAMIASVGFGLLAIHLLIRALEV